MRAIREGFATFLIIMVGLIVAGLFLFVLAFFIKPVVVIVLGALAVGLVIYRASRPSHQR